MILSTFYSLDIKRKPHFDLQRLGETNIDNLHTLGVHKISNHFRPYSQGNVYRLWLPNEWNPALQGLFINLLNRQCKFLKGWNVMDQIDIWFTMVPHDLGLQPLSQPLPSPKSGSCQGNDICGMIRISERNYTWILTSSKNHRKAMGDTAPDDMVMGAVQALCEFCVHLSQQNDYDLSHKAVDNSLTWFFMTNCVFWEPKIL